MTAGETAISDIYKFALSYYDARAKEIGLPKTDGIYIHEGPVGNDDNDHDFVVEHSFFVGNDEDGNIIMMPRQLDYCYDAEQYIDAFTPEATDYLVRWFQNQKQMNESFTYYVTNLEDLMDEVLSLHYPMNEEYKGNENADIPRIWDLYYKQADNDDMIRQLGEGMFGLLNKVTLSKSLIEGVRLAQTQGHQYTMTNYPRVGLTLIWFTGDRPAVQELAVRQAIAYCLDRQSFTRGYVGPYGMQMDGYYGMGQWMYLLANGETSYPVTLPEDAAPEDEKAYDEAEAEWESISLDGLTKYHLDIGQAIRLLEKDGWTLGADGGAYDPQRDSARYKMIDGELVGLHLTMALPESVDAEHDMQVFFLSGLREAGIDVTLKKMDLAELQRMYTGMEQADVDMVYLGENFTILVNPEIFMPGEKDIPLNEVRSELYAMAQDMVHTDSGDLLGFMKKWVALQERITQTLPLIPVYSNVYFDFYTRELYDYDIEEAVTWSEAIVSSYMSEPETFDADRNTTVEEELKEMEMILLSGRQREYRTETEN